MRHFIHTCRMLQGQLHLQCEKCGAQVRVDALVPDIAMSELRVPRLLASDVQDEVSCLFRF